MKLLSGMRLKSKIGLSSGAMVAVLFSTVALSLVMMGQIKSASDNADDEALRTSKTQEAQAHVIRTVMRVGNLLIHEQNQSLESRRATGRCGACHEMRQKLQLTAPIQQETDEYERQLRDLSVSKGGEEEKRLLIAVADASAIVKATNTRLIGMWDEGKYNEAWTLYCTDSRPAVAKMDQAIGNLLNHRRSQSEAVAKSMAATMSLVRWILLLIGLVVGATALPLGFFMARDVATVEPQETVRVAADRFVTGDLRDYRHHALPIVDSGGQLQGLVTQGDLLRALQADSAGEMPVIEAGTRSLIVAYPDERVFDAVMKMLEHNIGRLPVVERAAPQKLVGYINRANVMGSWRGHVHEEFVREHGWFSSRKAARESRLGGIVTGRVTGCSNEEISIRVDGNGDGPVEEFALSAPARGVFRGDHVRVNYRKEDGRKIAVRIEELSSRQ